MQQNSVRNISLEIEENNLAYLSFNFQGHYLTDVRLDKQNLTLSHNNFQSENDNSEFSLVLANNNALTLKKDHQIKSLVYQADQQGIYQLTFTIRDINGNTFDYCFYDRKNPFECHNKGDGGKYKEHQENHYIHELKVYKSNNYITGIDAIFTQDAAQNQKDQIGIITEQVTFMAERTQILYTRLSDLLKLKSYIPIRVKNEYYTEQYSVLFGIIMKINREKDKFSHEIQVTWEHYKRVYMQYKAIQKIVEINSDESGKIIRFEKDDFKKESDSLESLTKELQQCKDKLTKMDNEFETLLGEYNEVQQNLREIVQRQHVENTILQYQNKDSFDESRNQQCEQEKKNVVSLQTQGLMLEQQIQNLQESIKQTQKQVISITEDKELTESDLKQLEQNKKNALGVQNLKFKALNKLETIDDEYSKQYQQITNKAEKDIDLLHGGINQLQSKLLNNYEEQSNQNKLHIIPVLDQSGSMAPSWPDVQKCYKDFIDRFDDEASEHLVSLILFDDSAELVKLKQKPKEMKILPKLRGGGTNYIPALTEIDNTISKTPQGYQVVVVFMTDGSPFENESSIINKLKQIQQNNRDKDFKFFFIGFGKQYNKLLLEKMTRTINNDSLTIKIRGKETTLTIDARDDYELKYSFQNLADLFQGDLIESQIDKLYKQIQIVKEKAKIEIEMSEKQLIEEQRKIKELEQIESKFKQDSIDPEFQKVFEIYHNDIMKYESKIKQLNKKIEDENSDLATKQIKLIHVKQQTIETEEILKTTKEQLKTKNQDTYKRAEQNEEELKKHLELTGFQSMVSAQEFQEYLESSGSTIGLLRDNFITLQSLLQTLIESIKNLVSILSQKQGIKMNNDEIIRQLQKQYGNIIKKLQNSKENSKEILKQVLKYNQGSRFKEIEPFFENLFHKINLYQIHQLHNENKLDDYILKLLQNITPSESNDGEAEHDAFTQKLNDLFQPQGYQNAEKSEEFKLMYLRDKDNLKIPETKEKIKISIEGATEEIKRLKEVEDQMITELKQEKKNLEIQHQSHEVQFFLKERLLQVKQDHDKNNKQICQLQNDILFFKGLLNPEVLKKNVMQLITAIISCTTYSFNTIQNEQSAKKLIVEFSNFKETIKRFQQINEFRQILSSSSRELEKAKTLQQQKINQNIIMKSICTTSMK